MNASPTTAVLPPLEWQPADPIPPSRIVRRKPGAPQSLRGLEVYELPASVGAQAFAAAQREQEAACAI